MNLVIKTKSSLWHFLTAIKDGQLSKEVEVRLILQGNLIEPRRQFEKQKELFLSNLKDLYTNGALTALLYINNLSYRMLQ